MHGVDGADNTSEGGSFGDPLQESYFLHFLKLDKDTHRVRKQILTFPDHNSPNKSRVRNSKEDLSCRHLFC